MAKRGRKRSEWLNTLQQSWSRDISRRSAHNYKKINIVISALEKHNKDLAEYYLNDTKVKKTVLYELWKIKNKKTMVQIAQEIKDREFKTSKRAVQYIRDCLLVM